MKLGLISMSGVHICDPQLVDVVKTLPGFMHRAQTIASLPNLGLLTLAALTPANIRMSYHEIDSFDDYKDLPDDLDIIAISSPTAKIQEVYRLADHYRARHTKVILGGLHVTALPEEAAQHADCIVLGEGEIYWSQIMADAQHNTLEPIYDGRDQSYDLSKSPIPRYDLLNVADYDRLTIQTQRGCPWRCEFCASSISISPKYKTKPVELVKKELACIKSLWKKPFIELVDDNTFVDKTYGKQLAHVFMGQNTKWFTETDISLADDDELLGLLRDSGCVQVLIGFENSSRSGLENLELNTNWKARQLDRYYRAISKIQSYGISVNGCFILGLDGTDQSNFSDVLTFVKQSQLTDVQITVQTPFPGTPLYDRLLQANRLIDPTDWSKCTLFDVNFIPDRMTVSELEENFRRLLVELYAIDYTKRRRELFRKRFRSKKRTLPG